nr:hypothetical protein [uncultured Methanobrevibacter sp.]
MLNIEVNDKIIKITDDQFNKSKINSIKIIIEKYGIKDILDFKLIFKEDLFGISEQSVDVSLKETMTIEKFFEIITDMFETLAKNSNDLDNINISFEGLFIL